MRYEYQTGGYERFHQAHSTFIRSSLPRRCMWHLRTWGVLLLGVVLLLHFLHTKAFDGRDGMWPAVVVGGLLCGGLSLPLMWPWRMRRAYAALNGKRGAPHAAFLEVKDAALLNGLTGTDGHRYERSAICDHIEDDDIFLLFPSKQVYIYIPKSAIPPQAVAEVHAWLKLPGAPSHC